MFGSLGVPELILIFAVILIVFGPRRIPEIGRTLGKAMAEFRKATDDLKGTIEREVRLEELKQIAPQAIAPFEVVSRSEPEVLDEPASAPQSAAPLEALPPLEAAPPPPPLDDTAAPAAARADD